ncbi:DUF4241 domain-containing protein [Spirillospora sp. NBC_00431]
MRALFEAVYADGWDDEVVNPLTRAVAEARDAAGEPYTVLLLIDGRRHAVLDISWSDGYCRVERYDAAGRRLSQHELRGTPDGDLFLRRARTWDGSATPDAGVFEFPHVAARHVTTYRLSGERTDVDEPLGDRGSRNESRSSQSPPRLPIPRFGQWQGLLGLAGDGLSDIVDAAHNPMPVRTGSRPPWRPPRPLQPSGIEELFATGAERVIKDRRLRLSTRGAGSLRLPSGRLVAADPSSLPYDGEPFSVTVSPGTYPVTVSLATFIDDPGHSRVVAARLDVTDRPVDRWELALRDSQDPLDLGHQEFFGFGVDAGMACFVDAEACDRLSDVWHTLDGLVEPRHLEVGDGDMVAWSSGWGDGAYPTWIGRDSTGAVACFVADMLLFPSESADDDEDDDD